MLVDEEDSSASDPIQILLAPWGSLAQRSSLCCSPAPAEPAGAPLQSRTPCAHGTREQMSSWDTLLPTLSTLLQHSNPFLHSLVTLSLDVHDQQLSAGSSMGSWDRRKSKGGLPQKRPFEGSLLPPFQAGSFHYLSPHPAPGDIQFRNTRSHLLLRKPQGQEAEHHPHEQTDTQKTTGEGKAESVGRRQRARSGAVGKRCPWKL